MKSAHYLRMIWLILISLIIIACGLFKPSDEIASLQSTIDALTSQQDTSQDNGEPHPPINTEDQTQATPEIKPTESSWQNALTYIDQYGGSTTTVAVKGNYAFMGQGPRMVVLDVSNPGSPEFVSESELLPGLVMGVEVEGDYAYVTTMFSGLNIFDISQANFPKLISKVEPDQPGCGTLTLKEGIAYIACNNSGLFIVDVNNPTAPKVLASDVIRGSMISIAIKDKYVYLADGYKGIYIVNVSDPTHPQQVGFFDHEIIPSLGAVYVQALDLCQGDLCLAVANHGFVILDLADPTLPTIKSSTTQFWSSGVISDGRYAYLVDELEGVRAFDIANPSAPKQVGLMPTAVGGFEFSVQEITERKLEIADNILYVPDQTYGLITIDISDPSQPVRVGQFITPVPDLMMSIKVVGDYAYAICRNAGFRVLDISDPENMVEIFFDDERKFLTTQGPMSIEVIGNYAYIADANYPLHIHDISNPYQPKEVGVVDGGPAWDGAFDLAISGNVAYLSGAAGNDGIFPGRGLWVIDIGDPTSPAPINFLDLSNENWSLAIHGSVLFALDGSQDWQKPEPLSLRIIDISNPTQPVLIKSLPIPDLQPLSPSDILVSGDWLYVSLGMGGLKLYNISDPRNPIETPISTGLWLTPYAHKLAATGSTLFINGNMAYNISDPTTLDVIGIAYEAQDAWTAQMVDDLVYIVTKFNGIYVYRLAGSD